MSVFGGRVYLQHGHIQPLWMKNMLQNSPWAIHSLPFMFQLLSQRAHYLHEIKLNVTGSISVQLFKSVCCGGRKKPKTSRFVWLNDLISCVVVSKNMATSNDWTHWRGTPNERGSTQSCQSECWGPVHCSGPRWSDAGGCWERSLSKCKKTKQKTGNVDAKQPEESPCRGWMCVARTSILHGHAHLRGTHTATAVHVLSFVQILMERPHMLT